MKCKKCGFDTPQNSNFCSHCGQPIDFNDEFISSSYSDPVQPKEEPKPDKQYFNRYREEDISRGQASNAWYVLGFLSPLVGFILYMIYAYRKPNLAYKARRGAIWGFWFDVLVFVINLLIQYYISR